MEPLLARSPPNAVALPVDGDEVMVPAVSLVRPVAFSGRA